MDADESERRRLRALVRAGYDAISPRYRADPTPTSSSSSEDHPQYHSWLLHLAALLPAKAHVLDLGCGAGLPAAKILVEQGFQVTGVDISAVQIRRARTLVPEAAFVQHDMVTWRCDAASFDAIVTLYALIHLPLDDQRTLLPRLAQWLMPGGYLLAIVGYNRWTGVEDYLGAAMFWDHADTATYLTWLGEAGFHVLWHRVIPDGTSNHTLIFAKLLHEEAVSHRASLLRDSRLPD